MHRYHSEPWMRQRGNVSIFVLALIMLLMSSVMGQVAYIQLMAKRGQGYVPGLKKDEALVNGPLQLWGDGEPGAGEVLVGQEPGVFTWEEDVPDGVAVDRLTLRFPNHPHWPRLENLWISSGPDEVRIIAYHAP